MKKALLSLMLVGTVMAGAATSASAQSVYFGFGTGGGGWQGHRHYDRDDHYRRPYRPYYQPYQSYGGPDCYYRARRYFDDYRGVWVVRRVRVCN